MSTNKDNLFSDVDICSKEADTVIELIKKSFPNECVIMIEKINNPLLEKRYNDCLERLKKSRGDKCVIEEKLFHGTDRKSVENIAYNGFMYKFSKVNAYGIGTYFAKNYSYSRIYSLNKSHSAKIKLFDNYDTMIIAKVILGVPTITKNACNTNTEQFDYSCDNIKNPTIYSIPYDDAAYPEYAITFYNSKNIY
jgi:hypothetical protein